MKAHSNEHLLNVIYQVPEHNIVSPFDEFMLVSFYEDTLDVSDILDSDDDLIYYD